MNALLTRFSSALSNETWLVYKHCEVCQWFCVVSGHCTCSLAVICEISAVVCAGCGTLYLHLGLLHLADLSTTVLQTHLTLRHQKCKCRKLQSMLTKMFTQPHVGLLSVCSPVTMSPSFVTSSQQMFQAYSSLPFMSALWPPELTFNTFSWFDHVRRMDATDWLRLYCWGWRKATDPVEDR